MGGEAVEIDWEDGKLYSDSKLRELNTHVTCYSLPEKAIQVCMLFKHDVQGNFFDTNCVEMVVKAVEMDWEDGKLYNDTKLMRIENSRDLLFTSGRGNTSVC